MTEAIGGAAKRAIDVAVAGALLLLLAPVLLAVGLLIRADSPGPALYRCRRVGAGGRHFAMLKFRKMADAVGGAPLRAVDDERFTRLGRFLAGTRLDEVPQLWNVVRGDMGIVGPRPEDPYFVEREAAAFDRILTVRPGITGLSQLAFSNEAEVLETGDRIGDYLRRILPQKLAMDLLYIERRSIWMDLRIMVWTVVAVALRRDVAVHRSSAAMGLRRRGPSLRRRMGLATAETDAPPRDRPITAGPLAGVGRANGRRAADGGPPAPRIDRRGGSTGRRQTDGAGTAVAVAAPDIARVAHPNGNGSAPPGTGSAPAGHDVLPAAEPEAVAAGSLTHIQVVILAGGRGTRLAPYTSILPKPLMPIGERSILETIVEQLAGVGVRKVNLCVGYLSHLIRTVFDNQPTGAVEIEFVQEQDALGTAAPLRLVGGLDDTFIVMNGDVLTTLDYEALVRNHRAWGNLITIATHDRRIKIDYGMLHLDLGGQVRQYEEKPEIVSPVSMGIYVMEPGALAYIPESGYFDFPSLVEALLRAGEPVGTYRHEGLWFDIGRDSDYHQAVAAWNGEFP